MDLTFSLSLEQRSLANIAITLWDRNDIRNLMLEPASVNDYWQGIEKAVINKSLELRLPKCLQKNLLNFIVRVGFQILSWVDVHHSYITKLPATFVWTSLGTINNIETAKLLLKGDTLDNEGSFALACIYCLENEIKYLWETHNNLWNGCNFGRHILLHWVKYMLELCDEEEMTIVHSPQFMKPDTDFLSDAIYLGNETAIKYFFNVNMDTYDYIMLTEVVAAELNNKDDIDVQRYSGIMLFLLSKMNAEQQRNVIVNNTFAVLKCLLVWPWHSLFLEIAKDMCNTLSKEEYSALLFSIVSLMEFEPSLHIVFEEFWKQSPEVYKRFFTDHDNVVFLLINLCKRGDEKNLKLVLKDSSISTKENIFKIDNIEIFVCLVSSKKWDLLEFLIQECMSSKESLIIFRDVFRDQVQKLVSENFIEEYQYFDIDIDKYKFIEKYQWNKFFQLVNDGISKYKRHIEDSTLSKKYVCYGLNNN